MTQDYFTQILTEPISNHFCDEASAKFITIETYNLRNENY